MHAVRGIRTWVLLGDCSLGLMAMPDFGGGFLQGRSAFSRTETSLAKGATKVGQVLIKAKLGSYSAGLPPSSHHFCCSSSDSSTMLRFLVISLRPLRRLTHPVYAFLGETSRAPSAEVRRQLRRLVWRSPMRHAALSPPRRLHCPRSPPKRRHATRGARARRRRSGVWGLT